MKWPVKPRDGSENTDEADVATDSVVPELEQQGWQVHDEKVTGTGFLTMAARLPALVAQALRLAWSASPATTAACVVLNVVSGVATTFGLLATQGAAAALLTQAPTAERIQAAIPSLIIVGTMLAARSGLSMAAGWAQARLRPLVSNAVETDFYRATTGMQLAAFDNASLTDEMDKSHQRGTTAVTSLVEEAIDVITGAVGVAAVAGALAIIHPLLLGLLIVAAIPTGWAAVRSARAEYTSWHARVARRRRLWVLENLMASRPTAAELRSLDLADWLLAEHRKLLALETAADFVVLRSQTWTRAVGGVIAGLAGVGVYIALGWLMTVQAVPLSAGAAAVLAIQSGRSSLNLLISSINSLFEQGLYAGDHTRFMTRAAEHTPTPRPDRLAGPPDVIRLEQVSLRYPDAERDAVDEVSLEIHTGRTIALVGENGSGKTSLAALIAGLYEPTGGVITWDGRDIAGMDTGRLREHIAVVTQDYHHWPFTAGVNIHIGRTTGRGGRERVEAAARAADAHGMITELPKGYNTLLDRRFKDGHDLSGGQWQRLTAARSFYRDAPILICDEPSAALDARAEHVLFETLKARRGTTILITHRLANVRHADAIYVLDHGRLIEQGTHDELTAIDGRYAELFGLQSRGYSAERAE
ncbi:ABC transporter ATP-binding protein [Phytomonospora sp. NPDC050363]|uniref:ABC transporter ATP-binding protein n=1 Tax=Phytomonospora sp. NPDC050363 TaxID=3155642 RepID=UPI0033D734D4